MELVDQTNNRPLRTVTRANSFQVPPAFMPSDNQAHDFQWRVSVAQVNDQGIYNFVGEEGNWRSFRWLGN